MITHKILILILVLITNIGLAQSKKIAYCSNDTPSGYMQIFLMNEDGSENKQLTDINENCMRPRWSPDGKQLVFYTDRGYIYLIRDVYSTVKRDPFYLWNGTYPSFMPEGDQVVYNDEYEDILSIMIIDTMQYGAEPQLLSDGGYCNMQMISADGSKIYFSTFDGGTKVIKVMDLDDTTNSYIKRLSINDEANLEPDATADDEKVTYASFDSNLKGTIRILRNNAETALTRGMPSSNVPRFSPDGSKIAFVVIDGNNVSLYVMNEDGSDKKNLRARGGNIGTFEWIDNLEILYDAGSESSTSIGIVNVSSGANDILVEGGFNLHPTIQK
jgi:Tol biopolymer transport system component